MSTMLQLFASARRASVPILVVRTADQAATLDAILSVSDKHPVVKWDAVRGLTETNPEGKKALAQAQIMSDNTIGFADVLAEVADKLPPRTVVLMFNAQRQLQASEPISIAANVQAVANLRDKFKMNFRMLVLLVPELTVPPELAHDVIIIDHTLPTPEELATVIQDLHASAKGLGAPTPEVLEKAVDAVSGLSLFEAEQTTAMSLTETGLDISALWERKRTAIEQTPGLSIWRGSERFDDLIGLSALKEHLHLRLQAKRPIGVVVWIDSIRVAHVG